MKLFKNDLFVFGMYSNRPFHIDYTDDDFHRLWGMEHFPILPRIETDEHGSTDLGEAPKTKGTNPESQTVFWTKYISKLRNLF